MQPVKARASAGVAPDRRDPERAKASVLFRQKAVVLAIAEAVVGILERKGVEFLAEL